MLEKANSTCGTDRKSIEKFLQADIESLPFNDSSFDMIICLGVIAYFKSEEKLLREFSRVLKESGVLILSSLNKAHLVMYFNDPSLVTDILRKLAKNTLKRIFGSRIETRKKKTRTESEPPARRRYLTPELENSLQLQGFSVLEHTSVPLELLTFRGRTILPLRANIKITMFLERFSNIPFIGTLGGMCIFRARKNPDGRCKESSLLQSA
jgi:ubiquinone/menaquinone biosynthesis C-methylase UbiE